jgi:hypothetical protein
MKNPIFEIAAAVGLAMIILFLLVYYMGRIEFYLP